MGRLSISLFGVLWLAGPAWGATSYEASAAGVQFSHEREAFDAWSFDTGWLPPQNPKANGREPIQIRFQGHVGGGAEAALSGQVHLGWQPWQLSASGAPGDGVLTMNLGVELAVSLKIDVDLPDGSRFFWEGPMPVHPGFDYRFAAEQTFTPFLLAGANGEQVLVSDTIQKTSLFELPLTSAIIPIPGVEGTLDVEAGGVLDVLLKNGRLTFPEGTLSQANAPLVIQAPVEATEVRFAAAAVYAALLEVVPQVTLHMGPLSYTLASFPVSIPLPPLEETWEFNGGEPQAVSFTLPRLEVDGASAGGTLVFDAETPSHELVLRNAGSVPVTASVSVTGTGFAVLPPGEVVLAPGEMAKRTISGVAATEGQSGTATITSGDPRGPLTFALRADPIAAGCAAAPGSVVVLAAMLFLGLRRRRR